MAKNGISRPFDKEASGYVRAETVSVAFLQKRKDAKRVYATVVNCKTNNDGFKKAGPMTPSIEVQRKLYEKVYAGIDVNPSIVGYIEAHATSTQVGDKQEVASIDEFFCKNRETPLKIGSVKSSMGHAEGAAAMSSLVKAILIFENEKLIPNINITTVRDDCPALIENRIKIADEVEAFYGDFIGVNSFGVLGANAHTLLKGNLKRKANRGLPNDDFPRLVCWSGRTDVGVNEIFNGILDGQPLDAEFIALLHGAQLVTNPANGFRGYGIFAKHVDDHEVTVCVDKEVGAFKDVAERPIVFVYSGVGSQWPGMGRDLIKIASIANVIEICHDILSKFNVDLKDIITSSDPATFDNPLNTFVGIAVIQIALTDLLKELGVEPNYIIGHSVGELGCAYADGTLTREEMILSAYSRGMAVSEVKRDKGAMAAIGMGYHDLKDIVPKGIEIACHNSSESCTIAGSVDDVTMFVKEMKEKNYLATVFPTSGIAFHSSRIAESGPILRDKLKAIIKEPKARSSKWISTSVPRELWSNEDCLLSSAEYHVNNLLNPVLFEEGVSLLPGTALVVEVSPHSLLLPILKRSVKNGAHIGLAKKDAEDGSIFLLKALGK